MKYLSIIFCFLIGFSIATPALADMSMTDQIMQNAAGDRIQTLEGQPQPDQAQEQHPSDWQSKTQEILINAMSLTGIKYRYGGSSPNTGFDCSGFVRYVFSQAANLTLPPTARAISQIGKTVRKDDLQPGDLVFFNTLKSTFSHVGIYLGDNKFIHAPRTGGEVRVESMQNSYWQSHYNGAQRLDEEATKSLPVAQK
jgi:cell wall-associated NlpC family hydrolase